MISFYPGPSRIHDEIPKYVKDAHRLGIMSINHRSPEFIEISKRTVGLLKQRLKIPKDYTIFFTSSATECWEILAQSLIVKGSYHFYNGAFGEKWFDYTKRLHENAIPLPFNLNDTIDVGSLKNTDAVICITQNETSNGTQVSNKVIGEIKSRNPEALIAIDATSSMGGVKLNFRAADIWFASVQKCFGLPAGLGLMFCSPKAIEEGKRIGEKSHYNSLSFMINMMEKWQTPFTPNVLGIYLLMRVLEDSNGIADTEKKVKTRYELWLDFLAARKDIAHLVENRKVHSYTVLPIQASEGLVDQIKKEAKKSGLLLGEGYGSFKPYTFRVANFPALKDREIKTLQLFLKDY